MFWFDKKNPNAIYCDNRCEVFEYPGESGRTLRIEPDLIADFRSLPFEDETFYHVVFDPPHYTRNGKGSRMGGIYGTLPTEGWEEYIKAGFSECMRVLKPYGTLVFKWNDLRISTRKILNTIEQAPLYGHISGKSARTHWMVFMKFREV